MRLLTIVTFIIFAVQSTPAAVIKFSHSVSVKSLSDSPAEQKTDFEAGQEITLPSSSPAWISTKGRVPLLFLPEGESGKTLELQLPEVLAWPPGIVEAEIDSKMTSLLDEALVFQEHLRAKDYTKAEKSLAKLQSRWDSAYLGFLEAQLYFLKGDLKRARAACERGLLKYPNNENGLRLMAILKGATR